MPSSLSSPIQPTVADVPYVRSTFAMRREAIEGTQEAEGWLQARLGVGCGKYRPDIYVHISSGRHSFPTAVQKNRRANSGSFRKSLEEDCSLRAEGRRWNSLLARISIYLAFSLVALASHSHNRNGKRYFYRFFSNVPKGKSAAGGILSFGAAHLLNSASSDASTNLQIGAIVSR